MLENQPERAILDMASFFYHTANTRDSEIFFAIVFRAANPSFSSANFDEMPPTHSDDNMEKERERSDV